MDTSDDRLTPSRLAATSEDLMTTLWLGIHRIESKSFLTAFVAGDAKAAKIHLANADAVLARVGLLTSHEIPLGGWSPIRPARSRLALAVRRADS